MKPKHLFIGILAVLFVFPLIGSFAQQAVDTLTIQVITSFDYPGDITQTIPEGINDRGDITGLDVDTSGITRGFIRFHAGSFSAQIVEPNDPGVLTEGRGINHARAVTGFYTGNDGFFHGYFVHQGVFSEFNVAGANDTLCEGLNNFGDFVGAFDSNTQGTTAFSDIGGTMATINIPGATLSYAFGINRSRQSTGQYTDSAGVIRGWWQDSDGTINAPFDPPGSTATLPFGLNERGVIIGRFIDNAGVNHGFLYNPVKNTYVTFDYPGSVFTSMNGLNGDGKICGRYDMGDGILHGFLGQVVTGP